MSAIRDSTSADPERLIADLQTQLAECRAERDEALRREAAAAEILQVINASAGDLAPVFDAMLEKAMRLCEASFGIMFTVAGESARTVAARDVPAELDSFLAEHPPGVGPDTLFGRAILERTVLHTADVREGPNYRSGQPLAVTAADRAGVRALMMAPLLKDDVVLGLFAIFRDEARPFTEKQIALLQNFAAQAVIAMENARLLTETREALDQQTATAEVLQVINSSPGDLAPVFDAALDKALDLCGAAFGTLWICEGDRFRAAALRHVPKPYAEFLSRQPIRPAAGSSVLGQISAGNAFAHVLDVAADAAYQNDSAAAQSLIELGGFRTVAGVPLRKDSELLGAITIYRREVRAFTAKQIALLQNFAAQAVVAMENARLLTETREALEQQTATAEVLGIINSSPGDLAPVFDAMLEKAIRLCEATYGHMFTYDGENFHPTAATGELRYVEWARRIGAFRAPPSVPLGRITRGERVVHIADVQQEQAYFTVPAFREQAELRGIRSQVTVGLLKDNILLGAMSVYRKEVRPFTDKQIALLQNFAAQAVIAMENARLLTETREALAQQTATAEVLQVINSSPGDLAPVFDAILEKAHALCGAEIGSLTIYDGEENRAVATRGLAPGLADRLQQGFRPGPAHPIRKLLNGARIVQVPDVGESADPIARASFELAGIRTSLYVPLRKDHRLLGLIVASRQEVRLFSDKEIALLQNFAAQAVIAMENARLLTETREALEQQTATAEVLQVINSSPGDLAPVFDAMLERAVRLSGASFGIMNTYDGERFRAVALHGVPKEFMELRQSQSRDAVPLLPGHQRNALSRIVDGEELVHIADLAASESYAAGDPRAGTLVEIGGARSLLAVPLRKDGLLLGTLTAYRQEVRPFTDKQIALLKNFAAQAVIAMENARLITETREALAQQTATAEVLQVINSSPGDLTPVFGAMLEKALALCGATNGHVFTFEDGRSTAVAARGEESFVEWMRQRGPVRPPSGSLTDLLMHGERVVHMRDAIESDLYRTSPAIRELLDRSGIRTVLAVALRKEKTVLGAIVVNRREVRPFSEKQIALLQNFAAQAVIAMENARLLTETREALARQTATAEVLQVINSSPGNLSPVFDAILEKAHTLCGAAHGSLTLAEGECFRAVAMRGVPQEFAEVLRQPFDSGPLGEQLSRGQPFVQISDITAAEFLTGNPVHRAAVGPGGVRTLLAVPLRKDGALLGYITANRREVRPFTDKQIALLQNFAAQAVIAMENARLLTETREALAQQTATAEVLQVINSSPGDLAPVFGAMLEKATRLCEAAFGNLYTFDGSRYHSAAVHGKAEFVEWRRSRSSFEPGTSSAPLDRLVAGERVVAVDDAPATEGYRTSPGYRGVVDASGVRSGVTVALGKDNALLGAITVYRQEVRPFSDKQIALLQNFAAQAVIAIENARLLTETREALAQQTATAEVLQVINSSPGDLAPVFDTMVDTAARLCGTNMAGLAIRVGDAYRYVATRSLDPEWDAYVRSSSFKPERGTATGRTLLERRIIHVADLAADPEHAVPEIVSVGGIRTFLGVPLLREGEPIGVLALARQDVEPFSEQQIALVGTFAAQAVIAMENARLITETREALEQQTATAEVLGVINSSPGELSPVFDAMLEKAMRLCAAAFGYLMTYDGERFHPVAQRGLPPRFADYLAGMDQPGPSGAYARIRGGTPLVHIADLMEGEVYQTSPLRQALVDLGGARTGVVIALRKEDALLGVFTIYRQEVRPFTEKQIALLENFAAQAVIAMENARLLTETREALAQQTATAEVLGVISSSPGELSAVFEAVLDRALRLCEAVFGSLLRFDGEHFRPAATRNFPPALPELYPAGVLARLTQGEPVVQVSDISDTAAFADCPDHRAMAEAGARTAVWVALRKDSAPLGAIVAYRQEVRPFSEKEIALLENFAAQAVIAIENARLLNELQDRTRDLQEALEYQTATSDVLQVISRSTFNLQPVLDAVTETSVRLCAADYGHLAIRQGEGYRSVAMSGMRAEHEAELRARVFSPGRDTGIGRALLERRIVHVADLAADPEYGVPNAIKVQGARTVIAVPLMREGEPIGVMALARTRVEPFTGRQIELVRTFADQAVIAIENTRLITETREALEQQTATAEILEVINRSPGNLGPVFEAIVEKAHRLCGADHGGLALYDGDCFRGVAQHGYPASLVERLRQGYRPSDSHPMRRLLTGDPYVQVADLAEIDDPAARSVVELGGIRTTLFMALRKDDELLGMFTAARGEVCPFSEKEISVLLSFAAQAVIAIDNARLLDEIRRRQAELRVTFDNMGDGVAMFDGEQRLAAWNRNFQELLDLPDEFLAGRPSFADYFHYLAARGEYGSADREAELGRLIEDTEREVRFERTRPDGRVIEVRRNAVPGGGSVLIYGDITERKRAEAEIHAAREAAERALRELQTAQASLLHAQKMAALGQLTAGIAHEIKNPLNFVNNFAGLSVDLLDELKETVEPAMAALGDDRRAEADEIVGMLTGNLERIAEHGRRADGIVTSMLAHSRGGSGERRRIDVNALVEEALNLAYHGARAQDQSFNITLECELAHSLAPLELVPQDMTRVLLNLFGNGFYAAAKRGRAAGEANFRPALKVATRDLGEAVEIRVRDNGAGIAPEIRDRLFQPFFTTKPTGEGTGLGLSISWDIVTQQHGGTIEVDSRAGEFTEFTIRLPRAYRASAEAAA